MRVVYEEYDRKSKNYDFDVVLTHNRDHYDELYHFFDNTETIHNALYINDSAYVKKSGLLREDGMLMSKHFMDKLWSWDHCFNAMALSHYDQKQAFEQFMILFRHMGASGVLPDSISDGEFIWGFVKPPIHGFALRYLNKYMEFTDEQSEEIYEKLSANLKWWLKFHMYKEHGLLHYTHGNDSGWDNGSAFKGIPPFIEPDLESYAILEWTCLEN